MNFEPMKESVIEHATINLSGTVNSNNTIGKITFDNLGYNYFHFITSRPYAVKVHFNKELGGFFICTNPDGTNPSAPCCKYEEKPSFWYYIYPVIHYEGLGAKGEVIPGTTKATFKCLAVTNSGQQQFNELEADGVDFTKMDIKGKKDGSQQTSTIRYTVAGKSRIDNEALSDYAKTIKAVWDANNDGETIIKFVAKPMTDREYLDKTGRGELESVETLDDSDFDNNPFDEDED